MTAAPRPPRWTKDPPPRVVASPPVEALAADIAAGVDPATATAAFWAAAEIRGTPLVDRVPGATGERIVTFLWRDRHGAGDGTRGVVLIANKLTDPSLPAESGLERLQDTDVWWRAYRLSSAWRGTYALAADDGAAPVEDATEGPRARWRGLATRAAADVRNPRSFPGNRGAAPLSVLELPDAPPQPHSTLPAGAARGALEEVRVPTRIPGEGRRAWVHVPAVRGGGAPASRTAADGAGADGVPGRQDVVRRTDADESHRLLILLDGDEWTGRRDAPTILDALHHHGLIPRTITLMVDGGGADARTADAVAGASYLDLLTGTLPGWMRERYPVGGGREHLVLAGQSLGGLAVLRAASHAPDRVGAVVAQSSSLWWGGQDAPDAPSPTVQELRARPPVGVRVHAQVGRDEWVILRSHHALRAALAEAGVEHELHEYEGGHDAFCWRGGLAEGLIRVLGTSPLDGAPFDGDREAPGDDGPSGGRDAPGDGDPPEIGRASALGDRTNVGDRP